MTTEEYNKLVIEYNLVEQIISEAETTLNFTHPLMQYLYRLNVVHPDCIVSMDNQAYDIVVNDLLKHKQGSDIVPLNDIN